MIMRTMEDSHFEKLMLISKTIESLAKLDFHAGNSGGVLVSLYDQYNQMKAGMSPVDLLAFCEFVRSNDNV